MNHRRTDDSESRFAGYVEGLASVIGHKDREEPLRHYCTGLLMPCERKSVEPMAAITSWAQAGVDPEEIRAAYVDFFVRRLAASPIFEEEAIRAHVSLV